jgi:hypothetical protein
MERHVQADNAFLEWMVKMSKNTVHIADAWYAAVKWADSHPNWTPVEDYEKDELPSLMDKEDQYGCSVSTLFVVNLDGAQYINKGCFDYDIGVWHSMDTGLSYAKEQVTHWMSMPTLPRKEE